MAFKEEELDSSIDFNGVETKQVRMIAGRNQMVYWKGCNVTVFERDNGGAENKRPLYGKPDGQGILPIDSRLYVFGGKVKEEH